MKTYFRIIYVLLFLAMGNWAFAQEETDSLEEQKKFELNGYINYSMLMLLNKNVYVDNVWHNRLNFKYHFNDNIHFVLEGRNRLYHGASVNDSIYTLGSLAARKGYADLSIAAGKNGSWIYAGTIDRLYFDITIKKLQVILGRQRINWGRTIAYNPNDIFNASSYFDVDYVEKGACDAIRLQYYVGVASKIEFATKLGSDDKLTMAGMFKTNFWGYDFQIFGGLVGQQDYAEGIGWEGYIGPVSFRGEGTYFHPKNNFSDTSGVAALSVGFDYLTGKELMFRLEFSYSQYAGKYGNIQSISNIYTGGGQEQNAKTLAIDEYTLFASASYPLTPLINTSLSGMYFIDNNGFFISPSIDISITQNLDFSINGQYFNFEVLNSRFDVMMLYWRIKYNF